MLVSFDPEVEVLDLDEVEKDYFESQKDFDMDEEKKAKVEEIFKAFGVDR